MICQHKHKITVSSGNTTHKYKIVCRDCNKFLKWTSQSPLFPKKPYVAKKQQEKLKDIGITTYTDTLGRTRTIK